MIVRLAKLLIVVIWIPISFTLVWFGLVLFIPLWITHIATWLFTGRGFDDWLVDKYLDFVLEGLTFRAVDKIIEYEP